MFHGELWKSVYFEVKRLRSRVAKTLLEWVFALCECWFLLVILQFLSFKHLWLGNMKGMWSIKMHEFVACDVWPDVH